MQLGKENFRFVNKLNLNMNPSKGVQHNAGTWSVQVFVDYLSESSVLIRQFGKTLWSLVKTDMALLYRILILSPCTLSQESQVLVPKFIRCSNYFKKFLNSCKYIGVVLMQVLENIVQKQNHRQKSTVWIMVFQIQNLFLIYEYMSSNADVFWLCKYDSP